MLLLLPTSCASSDDNQMTDDNSITQVYNYVNSDNTDNQLSYADENSILNTVRDLIKIRKTYPALNVNSSQKFIEKGYPAVYERTNGDQTVIILINPADKEVKRSVKYSKVIKAQNAEICGEEISLKGQSFAILLK
jgi:glycosidase